MNLVQWMLADWCNMMLIISFLSHCNMAALGCMGSGLLIFGLFCIFVNYTEKRSYKNTEN